MEISGKDKQGKWSAKHDVLRSNNGSGLADNKEQLVHSGLVNLGVGCGIIILFSIMTSVAYSLAPPGGVYFVVYGAFLVGVVSSIKGLMMLLRALYIRKSVGMKTVDQNISHKSVTKWVVLLVLPYPLVVVSFMAYAVVNQVNASPTSILVVSVNSILFVIGLVALVLFLLTPLWIVKLVRAGSYNKSQQG